MSLSIGRLWLYYYDLQWNQFNKNKEWRMAIDPINNNYNQLQLSNWFVKNKSTFGNAKYILRWIVCFVIISTTITEILLCYKQNFLLVAIVALGFWISLVLILIIGYKIYHLSHNPPPVKKTMGGATHNYKGTNGKIAIIDALAIASNGLSHGDRSSSSYVCNCCCCINRGNDSIANDSISGTDMSGSSHAHEHSRNSRKSTSGSKFHNTDELGIAMECFAFVCCFHLVLVISSFINIVANENRIGEIDIISAGATARKNGQKVIWGCLIICLTVLYPRYYYFKSMKKKEKQLQQFNDNINTNCVDNVNLINVPWTRLVSFYQGFEAIMNHLSKEFSIENLLFIQEVE